MAKVVIKSDKIHFLEFFFRKTDRNIVFLFKFAI